MCAHLSCVWVCVGAGILDTPVDQELEGFVEMGCRAFKVPICAINFIDSDRQWSKVRSPITIPYNDPL